MSKEIMPNSIIGEGAEFSGAFRVAGSFRIDGHFDGQLTVDDYLYISPIGKLKTDTVYAKTVAIAGIFMGDIEASHEVQLLSTGRVLGNIRTPKLVMEPGVVVQGNIDVSGTKSQDAQKMVKESFASTSKKEDIKVESVNSDSEKEEK